VSATSQPPVLLTQADYYGTLAAARELGRRGIRVTVAHPDSVGPASWSRHVARRLRCPPVSSADALLAWLLEFGAREPGHVLYPTSDDVAWLLSANQEALGRHFRLYSPPVAAIEELLDKGALHARCAEVGIETPPSWFPETEAQLSRLAGEVTYPLLLKQRTQVLSATHTKGYTVGTPDELLARFAQFARENPHGDAISKRRPEACLPMLQAFFPEVDDGTLLMAGFVSRSGELVAARACRKILQRPRRLGIALCLEETPLDADLAERIANLCRKAGYHGVFHVEFIRARGKSLLIDFNPRYYHHMAFEIARGMPLPHFAYLGACGDEDGLRKAGELARQDAEPRGRVFTHKLDLRIMVVGQHLSGRMSSAEAGGWRRWYAEHLDGDRMTDAVASPADRLPGLVDTAMRMKEWGRHPRSYFRQIVLDQQGG
jgi:predicted ATP-grasp superfamily ATP-dependent carboligase